MRSASNSLRNEAAISSNAGGRKRAGISSVPISNNNSFAMAILIVTTAQHERYFFRLLERKTHLFPLFQVAFSAQAGHLPHPADEATALGHADGPPGIQEIEGMGAFQAVIVGREHQVHDR